MSYYCHSTLLAQEIHKLTLTISVYCRSLNYSPRLGDLKETFDVVKDEKVTLTGLLLFLNNKKVIVFSPKNLNFLCTY